jgi:hypothetical protein
MARSLLIAVSALAALAATPALAQQSGREAGLRYLTWPGRPAASAPSRPERQTPPPRPRPQPQPQPEAQPPPVADSPVQARIEQISAPRPADEGPRYYSVHRGAGRTPDPISGAQILAAEDTLVALQTPTGQTLAEQDRTARAEEAFEILRNLPPDQLMDMLDRTQ